MAGHEEIIPSNESIDWTRVKTVFSPPRKINYNNLVLPKVEIRDLCFRWKKMAGPHTPNHGLEVHSDEGRFSGTGTELSIKCLIQDLIIVVYFKIIQDKVRTPCFPAPPLLSKSPPAHYDTSIWFPHIFIFSQSSTFGFWPTSYLLGL